MRSLGVVQDIGPLNSAADIAAAQLAVAEAMCSGQISPEEAAELDLMIRLTRPS
jgi:hypothetical protein